MTWNTYSSIKNYTKITALEQSVASYRGGLKDILHCAQTFALNLGVQETMFKSGIIIKTSRAFV